MLSASNPPLPELTPSVPASQDLVELDVEMQLIHATLKTAHMPMPSAPTKELALVLLDTSDLKELQVVLLAQPTALLQLSPSDIEPMETSPPRNSKPSLPSCSPLTSATLTFKDQSPVTELTMSNTLLESAVMKMLTKTLPLKTSLIKSTVGLILELEFPMFNSETKLDLDLLWLFPLHFWL